MGLPPPPASANAAHCSTAACSGGYHVAPVRTAEQQHIVNALVRRRFAWRGYSTEALAHDANMHVILIDDARLCSGRKGWMTVGEIEEWAAAYGYNYEGVTDDVARLVPR